jgi:hypothetical protein
MEIHSGYFQMNFLFPFKLIHYLNKQISQINIFLLLQSFLISNKSKMELNL